MTWLYSLVYDTTCYGPFDYGPPYPVIQEPQPVHWWQMLTDEEWEYQVPIDWIEQDGNN